MDGFSSRMEYSIACQTPATGPMVMQIDMIHYLINISDLQSCMVMILIHILVNVLDGLNSGAELDIDVTVVLCYADRKGQ